MSINRNFPPKKIPSGRGGRSLPGFLVFLLTLQFHSMLPETAAARTLFVDQNRGGGEETADGSAERPFRSIQAAAEAAKPGDIVEIHAGVYRERIAPRVGGTKDAPITYRALETGTVIVKGSDIWHPIWEPLEGAPHIMKARLDLALFEKWRHSSRDPKLSVTPSPFHEENIPSNSQDKLKKPDKLHGEPFNIRARPVDPRAARWPMVIGQVYANSEPLHQALSLKELHSRPGSFTVDPSGEHILVHFSGKWPETKKIGWEITTREQLFAPDVRGLEYIILDGITFEHAANQSPWPSVGAVSVRNGRNWTIQRCIIRHNASVGLDLGGEYFDNRLYGDDPDSYGHTVSDCKIHDNGLTGIFAYKIRDSVIRRCEIHGNNRLGFRHGFNARWEEYAGIKLLHSSRNRIEENYIHDNHAFGVWFDNQWQGCRISRNLLVSNRWGGIFIEFGESKEEPLLLDNNVILSTAEGSGIYCHDGSDIVVAHNLLAQNTEYGLWMWAVSGRGSGASRNRVVGNVFYGNGAGNIGFPGEGEANANNSSDDNIFCNKTWARSPDVPTFSLHESHSKPPVSRRQVARQIQSKLAASGRIEKDLSVEFWNSQPARSLTLPQWRIVTGNDVRSSAAGSDIKLFFKPALAQLELEPTALWTGMRVPAVPRVEKDYFGRPYPADGSAPPGPFLFTREELEESFVFASYGRDQGRLVRKDTPIVGRLLLNLWPRAVFPEK